MKQWLRSLSGGERVFWSVAGASAFGAAITAFSSNWFAVLVGALIAGVLCGLAMVFAEHGQT